MASTSDHAASALRAKQQQIIMQDVYAQAAAPPQSHSLHINTADDARTDERGIPRAHAPKVTDLSEWRAAAEAGVLPPAILGADFLRSPARQTMAAVGSIASITNAHVPINPRYLPLNSPSKAAAQAAMAATLAATQSAPTAASASSPSSSSSSSTNNHPRAKRSVVGPRRALLLPKFVATGKGAFDTRVRALRDQHNETLSTVGIKFQEQLAVPPAPSGLGSTAAGAAAAAFDATGASLSSALAATSTASPLLLSSLSLDQPVAYPVVGGPSAIAASPAASAAAQLGPAPSLRYSVARPNTGHSSLSQRADDLREQMSYIFVFFTKRSVAFFLIRFMIVGHLFLSRSLFLSFSLSHSLVSEHIGSLYAPGLRLLAHRLHTEGKSLLPLASTTVCAALPEVCARTRGQRAGQ